MAEEHNNQLNTESLVSALKLMLNRGRSEVKRVGSQSKNQLHIRSLKKDRSKMYEKLGKEVEQLIVSGELVHQSLQRGFDRLQELHKRIEEEEEAQ